jgi:hypothetical protein
VLNVLPNLLNGPRETLLSHAQYFRMDPELRLRSAANRMAWATLSFDETQSITLIWLNALLRELLKVSAGPSVTP